jgi:hypothetical protein
VGWLWSYWRYKSKFKRTQSFPNFLTLAYNQPFTADFPRADIHELLAPDLLHQIIKGTFKDHLVTWVTEYVTTEHSSSEGFKILADIDRR